MIEGFNNFEVDSDQQQTTTNGVEGSLSFTDLFTSEFMQLNTQFDSIEELLSAGGFVINSEEDYEAIPDEDIDAHVAKTTKFDSWKELLTNAIETTFTLKN
ncbi:hypothetical protein [Desulfosporosinus sp. OT]|uniref:hypothetical protein n=1 Tax=Desulfosporosinus sp. OT TaxID=913865 RepID=UPI0002239DEE|nr:hypothetical protein [Desulfosporosinus sp. OT]EGW40773.1 hypothetical protein DOT_1241 [Desulfosporosinus sp. OT]